LMGWRTGLPASQSPGDLCGRGDANGRHDKELARCFARARPVRRALGSGPEEWRDTQERGEVLGGADAVPLSPLAHRARRRVQDHRGGRARGRLGWGAGGAGGAGAGAGALARARTVVRCDTDVST
jgi:hypothetical protein